jgi:hypothetical protein
MSVAWLVLSQTGRSYALPFKALIIHNISGVRA